jgi:hypothetical protein
MGEELGRVSEECLHCVVEATEVGVGCAGHFSTFTGVEGVVYVYGRFSELEAVE